MTSLRAALTFFDFVIGSETFSNSVQRFLQGHAQADSAAGVKFSTCQRERLTGDEVMGLCVFLVDKSKDKSNSFKGKCLLWVRDLEIPRVVTCSDWVVSRTAYRCVICREFCHECRDATSCHFRREVMPGEVPGAWDILRPEPSLALASHALAMSARRPWGPLLVCLVTALNALLAMLVGGFKSITDREANLTGTRFCKSFLKLFCFYFQIFQPAYHESIWIPFSRISEVFCEWDAPVLCRSFRRNESHVTGKRLQGVRTSGYISWKI